MLNITLTHLALKKTKWTASHGHTHTGDRGNRYPMICYEVIIIIMSHKPRKYL